MITILKRPEKFAPSENPVIFQVESDNPNIVYFRVKLYDEDTTTVISTLDIYTTPATPKGSFIDLSRLLQYIVRWELNNDSTLLVAPMEKTLRAYRMTITERVYDAAEDKIKDGAVYDNLSDVSYVFNAKMGRITAHNFVMNKYVINKTTVASFMTLKPNFSKVSQISAEHLYFMQDGAVEGLAVRVRTYDGSGTLLEEVEEALVNTTLNLMYRINVSPKALADSSNVKFEKVAYYVVDVIDGNSNSKTEERVYLYEPAKCYLEYVNLLWVNSLGGIDSYSFVAPQDTVNMNRFIMKRNTEFVNGSGEYSTMDNNIYNPSDVIINNHLTTITKVNTQELKDAEAYWLMELFSSKQIFVEMGDGILVPALLNNTTYTIPKLKYLRNQFNTVPVEFTLTEGVIPGGAQAYSTKGSSIEFINSQMYTIPNNLPGYYISVDENGKVSYSFNYSANYR